MLPRLIAPPRLRGGSEEEGERRATWLELFYDLVFVVTVSALARRLSGDYSFVGALQFVGLFVPVWEAWVGHTIYATRFDTDGVAHRLCTFALMLAAAAMAVQIPYALEGGSAGFAAAYVGARLSLLILYARARRHVPEARGITSLYLTGFGVGAGIWAISILVPEPVRYVLWALGLTVDFATPWVGRKRGMLRRAPLDTAHLPERFGLFAIIVLGETMLAVVRGVSRVQWQAESVIAAVLAFGMAVCLWWLYFTYIEVAPFVGNLVGSGQPYIYVHLPIVLVVVVAGVGLEHAIIEASEPTLLLETLMLLAVGLSLWPLAFLVLQRVTVPQQPLKWLLGPYATIIAATALLVASGAYAPPLFVLGGLLAVLALTMISEMHYWRVWYRVKTSL